MTSRDDLCSERDADILMERILHKGTKRTGRPRLNLSPACGSPQQPMIASHLPTSRP